MDEVSPNSPEPSPAEIAEHAGNFFEQIRDALSQSRRFRNLVVEVFLDGEDPRFDIGSYRIFYSPSKRAIKEQIVISEIESPVERETVRIQHFKGLDKGARITYLTVDKEKETSDSNSYKVIQNTKNFIEKFAQAIIN